jgi:hypothetical protein
MTMFQEPPLVDLDEILDEEEAVPTRVRPAVWVFLAIGAVVGIAGLLTVLVVTAPALIDLVSWVNMISRVADGG